VNLVLALLLKQAIVNPHVVNTFEVMRKGREHFIVKPASALGVLRAIRLMKDHIEPLNLQSSVGFCKISLRKEFRDLCR